MRLFLHGRPRRVSLAAISIEALVVGRDRQAVAGPLGLSLSAGDALVVTGPNGAGKSTLLRTLAGLLRPLSGRVRISGMAAPDGEAARALGEVAHYVGHRNAMKPAICVGDNLAFWQRFLAPGRAAAAPSVEAALDAVGLGGIAHLPYAYLSAGQQRRASLARLIVAPRPVWLLDEPTAALDAASQARFAALVTDHLDSGGIAVAATHQPLGLRDPQVLELKGEAARHGAAATGLRDEDIEAAEGWL